MKPKQSYTYRSIDYRKPSGNFWTVWSDRDDIITTTGRALPFLEKYLVVDQTQDKIHIVRDNGTFDPSLGEFRAEPEDMGWVEKDKMLLWSSALYSDVTNFRIKVMTITTPEILQKTLSSWESEAEKLTFYNSPTTTVANSFEQNLFEIFFIMKVSGKRFLVSNRDDISRGNASDYVKGWVESNQLQVWDHRQAIEPKWDVEAANERRQKAIPAALFGKRAESEGYQTGQFLERAIWKSDPYSERNDPYFKRFPVFEKENNIFYTAVVSDMVSSSGEKVTNLEQAELARLINEHREERRNINVVFVIDGTRSMEKFLDPVRKGVQNSVLKIGDTENNYKFGAVIYRDYNDPQHDECFEVFSLTSNVPKFTEFIRNVDTQDPACYNETTTEGMYHGIYKACRNLFAGKEKETNMIILLGDAGDREGPNRTGPDKLIDYIVRYNVNFLALQVHHIDEDAYDDFLMQLRNLVLDAAEIMVDKQNEVYGNLKIKGLGTRPRLRSNGLGQLNQYYLIDSPITGSIQYAKDNEPMDASVVEQEVEKLIISSNENNNELLLKIEDIFNQHTGDTTGSFTPEIMTFLENAGLSTDQIEILTRRNFQFLMKSYTAYRVDQLNHEVFNYVLFLDSKELDDLIRTLERMLMPSSSYSEVREELQDTWLEVLRTNYGVTRDEIKSKTISEMLEMVTGLPSANPLLKEYTYDDLNDETKLPFEKLQEILMYCNQQQRELASLKSNPQFYFKSNDRAFYWIPHTAIP